MKILMIMRHAKSDYPPKVTEDIQRPLNRRGRKDVPRMAHLLKSYGAVPDQIISSPAVRAHETAAGLRSTLGMSADALITVDRLYLASPLELFACVHQIDDHVDSAVLVAHNPGLEEWISALCGGAVRLPTAAIAALSFDRTKWSAIGDNRCVLEWFVMPKLLKILE